MRQHILVAAAFSMALLLGAVWCEPASGQELIGHGKWKSRSGAAMQGTWEAELTRSGTELTGSFTTTGSPLFTGGEASGTIDGQNVVLGVIVAQENEATFSGKLSGESISGQWELPALNDKGVWHGTMKARKGGS